jgi:hypothetical protein
MKENIKKANEYLNIQEELRLKKEEKKKLMREMGDSAILDNEEKRKVARQFVDEEKKVKEFKLEYRASRDGWSAADFHRKSDNKGPTISIMKTSLNKILGGYS